MRAQKRSTSSAATAKPYLRKKHHKRPEVMWDWLDVLLIAITLVIAYFVSSNIINSTLARLLPGSGTAILKLALVLVFYVIEILVVAYIAHRHNHRFAILYRLKALRDDDEPMSGRFAEIATSVGLVLALLLLTRGFGMLWGYLSELLGWMPSSTSDLLTMFGTTPLSMALAVLCVVVLAPFIEEIIFRGVFLSTLETSMAPAVAVIATALIFAVYHASAWAFLPHLVLGLALGYLAVTRRTLWPAIALHALYNAVLMAAAFYATLVTTSPLG